MEKQYIDVQGIREPKLLIHRERRPVAGLESRYEVTRTGNVWSTKKKDWMGSWADALLHVEGQKVYTKGNYLVAITWLTEAQREQIREIKRVTPDEDWRTTCVNWAPHFGVSSYALEWVGLMPAEDFGPVVVVKQRYGQVLPEPPRS